MSAYGRQTRARDRKRAGPFDHILTTVFDGKVPTYLHITTWSRKKRVDRACCDGHQQPPTNPKRKDTQPNICQNPPPGTVKSVSMWNGQSPPNPSASSFLCGR
ncbi:hypothetical protein PGT21_036706 [Puccinia graminis f. sp. tritici]|uniref:Uncharacterized protein n=1 Tax=Puccinia graminis f. sp. tritici TaxID=56615 RepID=A0A5B0P3G2_PUCGR|nr:hypothetical protein PGT21_036706 [Puccinia graminis f. sp. tritici]